MAERYSRLLVLLSRFLMNFSKDLRYQRRKSITKSSVIPFQLSKVYFQAERSIVEVMLWGAKFGTIRSTMISHIKKYREVDSYDWNVKNWRFCKINIFSRLQRKNHNVTVIGKQVQSHFHDGWRKAHFFVLQFSTCDFPKNWR